MPAVTSPPLPKDATPRLPSFSIQASVQTIPKAKDYEFRPQDPLSATDRRLRIDRRADTPVIVTGLLNIGRGDWMRFTRPYDLYLNHLMDLLRLDNRFIIYCDEEAEQFLASQPDIQWERIQLVRITLNGELILKEFWLINT